MKVGSAHRGTMEGKVGLATLLFILCTLLGLGSAAVLYFRSGVLYESQAKLLVRYVVDRSWDDSFGQIQIPSMAGEGEKVIGAEIAILTSYDLAREIVNRVGLERLVEGPDGSRILPHAEAGTEMSDGIAVFLKGLKVESDDGSNLIRLSFRHPEADVSVEVLKDTIDQYFEEHLRIHRPDERFKEVSETTDRSRALLMDIEHELRKLRMAAGFVSVDRAADALEAQRIKVQMDLLDARADLAEQSARVAAIEALPPQDSEAGQGLGADRLRRAGLEARVEALDGQMAEIRAQFVDLVNLGPQFEALEQRREQYGDRFKALERKLEDARGDISLDPKSMPNISVIQEPSLPSKVRDPRIRVLMILLAIGGPLLGIVLAMRCRPRAIRSV